MASIDRLIFASNILAEQGHQVRIIPPKSKHGIQAVPDPRDGSIFAAGAPPDADVLVFQRVTHAPIVEAIKKFRERGIAVVVDVDDDLDRIDPRNPAWGMLHPQAGTGQSWVTAEAACAAATLVTVSTPALLDKYAPRGNGVVIPNFVPSLFLQIPRFDSPVFGWGGSLHSHPGDLQVMGDAVARLMREGHQFRVVGPAEGVKGALQLPADPDSTGPLRIELWAQGLSTLGVGVAPLADTIFNRAKCLDADTRIASTAGLVRIEDLKSEYCVFDPSGAYRRVQAVQCEPHTVGVLLKLKSGAQLKLTQDHKLQVTDGTWVKASDLSVGSVLKMVPERLVTARLQTAPWPSDGRVSRKESHDRQAFIEAPDVPRVVINERWARFLGLFAGDGSASGPHVSISCDGIDQDLIDLILEDSLAMGFWPWTEQARTWGGDLLRRRSVQISSTHFLRFLRGIGVVEQENTRRIVCIPEVIWRSPEHVVAAFLSGLFEADGTVSARGSHLSLSTKHHTFALDVQRILLAFGIRSLVRERKNRAKKDDPKRFTSYLLSLRRASIDVFAEKIGLLSQRKRAELESLTAKYHSNAYRDMTWDDEVIGIEQTWLKPVDIQVEGEEFLAAGIVSHNSRLKLIEKASLGIPTVFSPRNDYLKLHQESGIGIPAARPKDWYRELKRLVSDDGYRQQVSAEQRLAASAYTVDANAWRWMDAWTEAWRLQRKASTSPFGWRTAGHDIPQAPQT